MWPPSLILGNDCAQAVITGISINYKIACQVWQAQHRSSTQCGLEAVKSPLLSLRPHPGYFGPQQICQGGSQACKTVDKTVVVVGQAKELLDVLSGFERWPLCHCSNFLRIWLDPFARDYMPEEFHLGLCKGALAPLGLQLFQP